MRNAGGIASVDSRAQDLLALRREQDAVQLLASAVLHHGPSLALGNVDVDRCVQAPTKSMMLTECVACVSRNRSIVRHAELDDSAHPWLPSGSAGRPQC